MNRAHLEIPEDWWTARRPKSFFPGVYYEGDASREGFLNHVTLTQTARTMRECRLLEDELRNYAPDRALSQFRILDCPCGQGRHSIELARRGYRVVGVDLCPAAIAAARATLRKESRDVQKRCSFVEDDMRSLRKAGDHYSAIINMFFSFGFFSDEGNQATLRAFHSALEPNGLLLIHTDVNPHLIDAGQYGDRQIRSLARGARLFIKERWNSLTNRLEGWWTIKEQDGKTKSAPYSVRIYKPAELQGRLINSGFECLSEKPVAVFSEKLPVHKSQELLYVAMKA